jgi:hypothetical protein
VNVAEILGEINSALDWNPSLEAYKAQSLRAVNAKYLETSSQFSWLFLQPRVSFRVYAKVVGSVAATISATAGDRAITGAGTAFGTHMEGQTFLIGSAEFSIVSVSSATAMFIDPAPSATVVATANWKIEFRRYALPKDCVEPLGFINRLGQSGRGRFLFVDARQEEEYLLNATNEGQPVIIIEDESRNDRPPDDAPKAAATVGGSLEVDTEFDYSYTIVGEGRESPPSLVASATTTSTDRTIRLTAIEDTRTATAQPTGRTKRLYRRRRTDGGRWLFLAPLFDSTMIYDDDGTVTPSKDEVDVFDETGPRQYVRAWYTPSADETEELRYIRRPRRLQNDADVPLWPVQYHRLIVYLALTDIMLQHGAAQQASFYQGKATEMLDRMKAKYLTRSDRMYIRKGFESTLFLRPRWGVPSKVP